MNHYIIVGYTPELQDIWVVGDRFTSQSAEHYFKEACNTKLKGKNKTGMHCGDNFEIKIFTNNEFTGHIRNLVGRLLNTLARAFNSEKKLPAAIVMVFNEDLINFVQEKQFGVSIIYGRLLHYLFAECRKLLLSKQELLPKKAVCDTQFIWINLPFHNNFTNNNLRNKFNKNLDTIVALFIGAWSLKLKKIWDNTNANLFLLDTKWFTATGYMTYWMAVD